MQGEIQKRCARYEELEKLLADPQVLADSNRVKSYAKELSALKPLIIRVKELERFRAELQEATALLDAKETVPDMRALAQSEQVDLKGRIARLEENLGEFLAGEEPEDHRSVILEVRAGTGGQEASLFAADLTRMYTRYAARRNWKVEFLGMSASEVGGFKENIFAVEGEGVYKHLKFERGVHRVQRVPATEASGRIHTSTVTVAVLPQAEEVELQIEPKDLKFDVFRSSGPGGQSVNTTDSAVRVTHMPTGIVVSCQDERSQLKNKTKAMKVLRARLLERKLEEEARHRSQARRSQIGTGER